MKQEELKSVIEQLDDILKEEYSRVSAQLSSAGHRAPGSYRDDMNGCLRGMSIFRGTVNEFLRKELLNSND